MFWAVGAAEKNKNKLPQVRTSTFYINTEIFIYFLDTVIVMSQWIKLQLEINWDKSTWINLQLWNKIVLKDKSVV